MLNHELLKKHRNSSGRRVLIAEDQSADIVAPYMLIHNLGFDVTLAFDGEQAFEKLKRNSFDLFILDWNMPYVSGGELLARIEDDGPLANSRSAVQVILHSGASLSYDDFRDSKYFKIIDIWKKPLSPSDISKRLRRFLNK